eukprot:CAMPEP_0179149674 /NCGR_PEP_ID=MMETSP0796-20121207/72529_1 /TAXON_ID=73915 /ORGANISM="Pyrodinium bahamense, Strain pbaha01" /LENGTH=134 /DNA_ID=CAMNT_0020850547 /DNA_START=151 /DNA_END=555 /DNA_ORIENTATION=+
MAWSAKSAQKAPTGAKRRPPSPAAATATTRPRGEGPRRRVRRTARVHVATTRDPALSACSPRSGNARSLLSRKATAASEAKITATAPSGGAQRGKPKTACVMSPNAHNKPTDIPAARAVMEASMHKPYNATVER